MSQISNYFRVNRKMEVELISRDRPEYTEQYETLYMDVNYALTVETVYESTITNNEKQRMETTKNPPKAATPPRKLKKLGQATMASGGGGPAMRKQLE